MHLILAIIEIIAMLFTIIDGEYRTAQFLGCFGIITILSAISDSLCFHAVATSIGILLGVWNPFGLQNTANINREFLNTEKYLECVKIIETHQGQTIKVKGFDKHLKVVSDIGQCNLRGFSNLYLQVINENGEVIALSVDKVDKVK